MSCQCHSVAIQPSLLTFLSVETCQCVREGEETCICGSILCTDRIFCAFANTVCLLMLLAIGHPPDFLFLFDPDFKKHLSSSNIQSCSLQSQKEPTGANRAGIDTQLEATLMGGEAFSALLFVFILNFSRSV